MRATASVVFKWNAEDFTSLVESCVMDSATPYILKYMPRTGRLVEAGCGLARFVVYLSNLGYDIEGVEISQETVDMVRTMAPGIRVRQGDVARLPYADDSIAGVISLGVVEHFTRGPFAPLKEIRRVLEPGGYAVVTVPSVNHIRRVKYDLGVYRARERLVTIGLVRKLFRQAPAVVEGPNFPRLYRRWPIARVFLEYRFTRCEFDKELKRAGFKIVESVPAYQMDGLYHEFGRAVVDWRNWRFYPNPLGRLLNAALSKVPFLHNHMHLCVVRK